MTPRRGQMEGSDDNDDMLSLLHSAFTEQEINNLLEKLQELKKEEQDTTTFKVTDKSDSNSEFVEYPKLSDLFPDGRVVDSQKVYSLAIESKNKENDEGPNSITVTRVKLKHRKSSAYPTHLDLLPMFGADSTMVQANSQKSNKKKKAKRIKKMHQRRMCSVVPELDGQKSPRPSVETGSGYTYCYNSPKSGADTTYWGVCSPTGREREDSGYYPMMKINFLNDMLLPLVDSISSKMTANTTRTAATIKTAILPAQARSRTYTAHTAAEIAKSSGQLLNAAAEKVRASLATERTGATIKSKADSAGETHYTACEPPDKNNM